MFFAVFCVIFSVSANEIYPAIVGPVSPIENESSQVLARETDPQPKIPRVTAIVPPTPMRAPGTDYYKVPDVQTQSLIVRLSLVRSLMERHGRAYDYREHTIADLKEKLNELDAAAVMGP